MAASILRSIKWHVAAACVACVLPGHSALAQAAATGRARLAAGRVLRPGPQRPVPVPGQWVVLHRVGSDRAAPLDSARSGPDGRFRIPYATSGAPDALYFVSSRYDGIAYFSPPLRGDTVRGGDADVIVYPTTTDTGTLRLQGHHIVAGTARAGRREMAEIFELDNEGTSTVVARDSASPVFSVMLPAEAESLSVGPGDIGAGAVEFQRGGASLFAPISPGVRQLALTYLLPVDAFPASFPVQRPTAVLEVLLEEPRARVEGARLGEVAPATIDGRTFRRFLARDVPRSAVVRIDAPAPPGQGLPPMRVLAALVGVLMVGAAGAWLLRRPRAAPTRSGRTSADDLVAELAALDSDFERNAPASAETRAAYEQRRAELKARIARELAGEGTTV